MIWFCRWNSCSYITQRISLIVNTNLMLYINRKMYVCFVNIRYTSFLRNTPANKPQYNTIKTTIKKNNSFWTDVNVWVKWASKFNFEKWWKHFFTIKLSNCFTIKQGNTLIRKYSIRRFGNILYNKSNTPTINHIFNNVALLFFLFSLITSFNWI
jgi:hypothetical protein